MVVVVVVVGLASGLCVVLVTSSSGNVIGGKSGLPGCPPGIQGVIRAQVVPLWPIWT